MAVSLKKGQKVDLTKGNPNLSRLRVGLGWDVNEGQSAAPFDLDASVFMLNKEGRCPSSREQIYFGHLEHPSGSVKHTGDNLTGEGAGDDETIFVDLRSVPAEIEKLVFVVNIYQARMRRQNFGMVKNAYIHISDRDSRQELCRFDLGAEFSKETAVIVGEIYRHNGEWKFNAVGGGYKENLTELGRRYGLR